MSATALRGVAKRYGDVASLRGIEGIGLELSSQRPWWHPYVGALSPNVADERALDLVLEADPARTLSLFGGTVLLGWRVLAPLSGYQRVKKSDL